MRLGILLRENDRARILIENKGDKMRLRYDVLKAGRVIARNATIDHVILLTKKLKVRDFVTAGFQLRIAQFPTKWEE